MRCWAGRLLAKTNSARSSVGSGFPFDDLRRLDVLPSEDTDVATSVFERAKASYYGELAYDYDYRYYVKLNGRRDASSLFGGDQQADLFWAVGTAWTFSQEAGFAERRPLGITYGKLRASYGITGNSRLGVYTAQGVYEQEFFADNYGGALPAFVTTPPNDGARLGSGSARPTSGWTSHGWTGS